MENLDELMYGVEWKAQRSLLVVQGTAALPVCGRFLARDFLAEKEEYLVRRAVILLGDLAEKRIDTSAHSGRLETILKDGGAVLKAEVVRTLARSGDAKHLRLIRPLATHEDYLVRERVAEGLGKIGTQADTVLLEKLKSDENAAVRKAATSALQQLGGK